MAKRITLIHATPVSIQPIENAFAAVWPEAEYVNFLESSLSVDRARDGELTDAMCERFCLLGDYAATIGSDAVLFTCSAFAGAIEQVQQRLSIPVLKPNEAMLEAALELGSRLLLVVTFPDTISSMTPELEALAEQKGLNLELHTRLAAGAMEALAAGDGEQHDAIILAALTETDLPDVDAVILGQFSMSRAQAKVAAQVNVPVLTTPDAAVQKLKSMML